MTVEALAILGALTGVVGALTGVAALVWQMITHHRAGRRVTVTSSYAIPVYGPPNAPGFRGDDQVAITVTNRGGAAVTVTNYGVSTDGKRGSNSLFVVDRPPWATSLPFSVEPGGRPAELLIPVNALRRAHAEQGIAYRDMRPWVDLGDGRRMYSERAVPLE